MIARTVTSFTDDTNTRVTVFCGTSGFETSACRAGVLHHGHVGHHDALLSQQPCLQPDQLVLADEIPDQALIDDLGDHDRHDVVRTGLQTPHERRGPLETRLPVPSASSSATPAPAKERHRSARSGGTDAPGVTACSDAGRNERT